MMHDSLRRRKRDITLFSIVLCPRLEHRGIWGVLAIVEIIVITSFFGCKFTHFTIHMYLCTSANLGLP